MSDPGRLRLAGIDASDRRRRPSGEPPPLPYALQRTGKYWIAMALAIVAFWVFATPQIHRLDEVDLPVVEAVVEIRNVGLTRVMKALHALGSERTMRVLFWLTVVVGLAFKRFRHLVVFLSTILVVGLITQVASEAIYRPRPVGVEILGAWKGPSHPSRPVGILAVILMGVVYVVVPQGRWRQAAKAVGGLTVALLCVARLYLAVDHPTDMLFAVIIGTAVPLAAFRIHTPNEIFPITYRRGRAAHLDVGGARGDAIRQALQDQLGLTALEVTPFGLGGSAGSTPLRIKVSGEVDSYLFGKLYASTHLRADRWYKLGRTLLYGRLEDEARFTTVRQLVQHEDYLLRLMRATNLPVAQPFGFVEITPEREYLLVTEFLAGAREISEVEVDEAVIDDALRVVRALWEAGLAHRDLKPSNVLVRDRRVLVIDVAFAEVRPSPWRQAVDLANMMLVLALRREPEAVYDRALRWFTPDEIAEAFAATRGVTSPTQLRSMLRAEGRDLVARFRELAPPRPPISIQRWSLRRVALTAAVVIGAFVTFSLLLGILQGSELV